MKKFNELHVMPEYQKKAVLKMDWGEISNFQLRLQIEYDLTHQESADYIAQAYA